MGIVRTVIYRLAAIGSGGDSGSSWRRHDTRAAGASGRTGLKNGGNDILSIEAKKGATSSAFVTSQAWMRTRVDRYPSQTASNEQAVASSSTAVFRTLKWRSEWESSGLVQPSTMSTVPVTYRQPDGENVDAVQRPRRTDPASRYEDDQGEDVHWREIAENSIRLDAFHCLDDSLE